MSLAGGIGDGMLPPPAQPIRSGDVGIAEMLVRVEDNQRTMLTKLALLTNRVASLTGDMAAMKESLARMGIAVGASSGGRIGMATGITSAQRGQVTRLAWRYMMAGALKEVWTRIATMKFPHMAVNFPTPVEQLICLVDCVGDAVDSRTRSELSTICLAFNKDIESIYDCPEACLEQVCTYQVVLTALGKSVDMVKQGLYVVLPETFTSVMIHYVGVRKSTDLDDPHPYSIVTTDEVPKELKVDPYLCESMNVLTNAERKKILTWALTVRCATDIEVGRRIVRTHRGTKGKSTLQMVDGGAYVFHNGKRIPVNPATNTVFSGDNELPAGSISAGKARPAPRKSGGGNGSGGGPSGDEDSTEDNVATVTKSRRKIRPG